MGKIERDFDGRLFYKEEVFETDVLNIDEYKHLLGEDKWEVCAALCYLMGFDYFTSDSVWSSFYFPFAYFENAIKSVNAIYPLVHKAIIEKQLPVIGDFSIYPSTYPTSRIQENFSCYLQPAAFLKWASSNEISLDCSFAELTGLTQRWETSPPKLNDVYPFTSGQQIKPMKNNEETRFVCRVASEVLWDLDNSRSKAEIRGILKQGKFLKTEAQLFYIPAINAFNRWVRDLDPTGLGTHRGRRKRESIVKPKFSSSKAIGEAVNIVDLEYPIPATNFKMLERAIKSVVQTILFMVPQANLEYLFSYKFIKELIPWYWGLGRALIFEWVEEEFAYSQLVSDDKVK